MDNLSNVLLIVIDALRPDHLGCYGYRRETSPQIDSIAEEGIRFEKVISQSSWTKPSVASLLTSTCPGVHGVKSIEDILSVQATFLPTILKKLGYLTGCIQTNPFLSSESGFHQGFDYFIELFDKTAGVYKPRMDEAASVLLGLLERMKHTPFFLYLHVLDTHNPYLPPEAFQHFGSSEEDLFDGEISFVDYYIGIVKEYLIREGLQERTILIITADHGEEFGEHGHKYHAKHLHEEVLRVPLIISAPASVPSGLSIPTQVRSIDIVPTILELLGIPHLDSHQGSSLVPLCHSPAAPDRPALSQIGSSEAARGGKELMSLSDGEYKVIWNSKDDARELYHLVTDPGEGHNVAEEEEEKARELQSQAEELILIPEPEPFRYKSRPKAITIDEKLLSRLRALGYIE